MQFSPTIRSVHGYLPTINPQHQEPQQAGEASLAAKHIDSIKDGLFSVSRMGLLLDEDALQAACLWGIVSLFFCI